MYEQVEEVLEQSIRPRLREHFGDIEVTRIQSGTVYVRMRGQCASCASAQYTVEDLVARELTTRVPGILEVSIDTLDPELFRIAKGLLDHTLPLPEG